ncbi:MAG: phasin family protein [Gammaproteobacteria bacterium]|nr:phasin family protein [Gammaproteobacteria bacterium]MBL6999575.1 phasin family protein [Gammaproteobacteria bacterium]
MNTQAIDFINEYNTKAMLTLRAFGDLNVASTEWFISKQVELTNNLMDTALASSTVIFAAKTPAEAAQASSKMMQAMVETVTGYVKESTDNALKTREGLKVVIDDAYKLNTEYSTKAMDSSVEAIKKTAKKAA